MSGSPFTIAMPKGIKLYSRLSICFILGSLFLLLIIASKNDLIRRVLIDPSLGSALKFTSLGLVAFAVGVTLHGVGRLLYFVIEKLLWLSKSYRKATLFSDFFTDIISDALIQLDPLRGKAVDKERETVRWKSDDDVLSTLALYYATKFPELDELYARHWFYVELSLGLSAVAFGAIPFVTPWFWWLLLALGVLHLVFAFLEARSEGSTIAVIIATGHLRERNIHAQAPA
jgi:hypothetical protein